MSSKTPTAGHSISATGESTASSSVAGSFSNRSHQDYMLLAGTKLRRRMGAKIDERLAAPIDEKAQRQLEKFGWTPGMALGKRREGITEHIRVTKRIDERAGLGRGTETAVTESNHNSEWWKFSVADTLAKLKHKSKKEKKDKKAKKSKRSGRIKDGHGDENKVSPDLSIETGKDERGKRKNKRKHNDSTTCTSDIVTDLIVESPKKKVLGSDKKQTHKRDSEVTIRMYTDEELFNATGGARFGMRAGKTRNLAKWRRTESDI